MSADKRTSWLIELLDKVTGPMKKIQSAARAGAIDMDKVTAGAERASMSFGKLGSVIAGLGLAVGITALTQESIKFEKGMALVNTVMKQTPEQLALVSDQVRDLSKEVPLMREQFTTGLNDVVQAGVPAANAMQFLTDSAKAAVGGQADLGEVIKTTVSIVKAYGLEWDKQAEIQNRMQKAVDIGMMSMGEFASALPNVTVLGANLGVGIDELTGAFAAMTGVTGNASEVSTQLASMMSGLISPTSEATKMADQLGIAFGADSLKKAGGLANYLDMIMPKIEALASSTGQTKEGIIAQLFGRKEAVIGMLALTGQLQTAWSDATTQMANSAGAVDFAFGQMNQTVDAKIQKMKNSLSSTWDNLYVAIQPAITAIVDGISWILNGISEFVKEYPNVSMFIGVFAGVSIAVAALAGAFELAKSAVLKLNIATMANPIFLVVGLIAAGVALIISYWEDVKAWFIGFGQWMYDHMPFKWVIELVRAHIPALQEAFSKFFTVIKYLATPIVKVFEFIGQMIDNIWAKIKGMFMAIGELMGIPQNADFRNYGKVESSAAPVTSGVTDAHKAAWADMNIKGTSATPTAGVGAASLAGGKQEAGMSIAGGEGKIVNFKNDFKITVNGATKATKETAEEILRIITDGLSDQAIAISNM